MCTYRDQKPTNLLKILYLLLTNENRIKNINDYLWKNEFNNIKHFLYSIAVKSCCENDNIVCNVSEMLYLSIFYPNFLLNKLNKKIKSNKLVLGGQYITCPSNDKLVDELNGLIYDKSKSDKDKKQYIEKVIKAIKNTNFKLVNLMQIILFWHI